MFKVENGQPLKCDGGPQVSPHDLTLVYPVRASPIRSLGFTLFPVGLSPECELQIGRDCPISFIIEWRTYFYGPILN